jgi:ATP synthase protein I
MGMRSYRRPERVSALSAGRGGAGSDDGLTMGTGWSVFSTMISGLVAYGAIGWVIGHFAHISLLFPVGMLIGLVIAAGWVIYQYGRPHQQGNPPKGDDR